MNTETLSLIVAGIAIVVGPTVSWKIAKSQISAQVVSTNRQEWINGIRNELAVFLTYARSIVPAYRSETFDRDMAFEKYDKMVLAVQRVELMLNPSEKDHAELVRLMKSTIDLVRTALSEVHDKKETSNDNERITEIRTITPLAQRIFKAEWSRIKRGS